MLADEAKVRALQSFVRDGIIAFTDEEVADHFGVTIDVMRRRVNKARRELFGTISDAAIIKRAQRQHARKNRTGRNCQEPGCGRRLHPLTHASRRYCDEHRLPAARTRRHRQQSAKAAKQESRLKRP
jgi:phosphoribosylformylglycinamidine (FGAM) synthase-like enzyme